MRSRSLLPPLVVALAAVAACGEAGDDASQPGPTVSTSDGAGATVPTVIRPDEPPTTPARPNPGRTSRPGSSAPPRVESPTVPATLPPGDTDLERAIADVAARTGVDATAVVVIAEEAVTWRDSSIGCPQDGMQYLQVLTEGTRIVLEAAGQRFEYHRGGRRDLFHCPAPQPPVGE